jgi:hypothetical protein
VGLDATAHNPLDRHYFFLLCVCGGGLPGAVTYVTPSFNHAGCVNTTSGVLTFFFFSTARTLRWFSPQEVRLLFYTRTTTNSIFSLNLFYFMNRRAVTLLD